MTPRPDNPLIVQSDRSLMLHTVAPAVDERGQPLYDEDGSPVTVEHPRFAAARDALAAFAELEKSPDYLHTYRLTPVSVWNAAALGLTGQDIARTPRRARLRPGAPQRPRRRRSVDVAVRAPAHRAPRRPLRARLRGPGRDRGGALPQGHPRARRGGAGRAPLGRGPRARLDQTGADQDRLPGRRPRRLRRRRPLPGPAARADARRRSLPPCGPTSARRGARPSTPAAACWAAAASIVLPCGAGKTDGRSGKVMNLDRGQDPDPDDQHRRGAAVARGDPRQDPARSRGHGRRVHGGPQARWRR